MRLPAGPDPPARPRARLDAAADRLARARITLGSSPWAPAPPVQPAPALRPARAVADGGGTWGEQPCTARQSPSRRRASTSSRSSASRAPASSSRSPTTATLGLKPAMSSPSPHSLAGAGGVSAARTTGAAGLVTPDEVDRADPCACVRAAGGCECTRAALR